MVNHYNSRWSSSELRVGNAGIGELDITNGGKVESNAGYIGTFAGSVGTATVDGFGIDGFGSKWTNTGDLIVGHKSGAANTLNVLNSGEVSSNRGFLGDDVGAHGTATVSTAPSGTAARNSASAT